MIDAFSNFKAFKSCPGFETFQQEKNMKTENNLALIFERFLRNVHSTQAPIRPENP